MNDLDVTNAKNHLIKLIPPVLKNDLVQMIMYGSCARGDYNDDSDIDIALLTRCDRKTAKKYDDLLMDIVTEIAMQLDMLVEYICIPYTEFETKKGWYGYYKNIDHEGVVIYG